MPFLVAPLVLLLGAAAFFSYLRYKRSGQVPGRAAVLNLAPLFLVLLLMFAWLLAVWQVQ